MKKLLVLGGKPIGSIELVTRAKELGLYVIVTDYLPASQSPAKQISDESWNISTADINTLAEKCKETHIDGILTAVHEFNINRMLDLCEILQKNSYCTRETWKYCDDKAEFKALCMGNGIEVAKRYDIDINNESSFESLPYPVVVKPLDGSGSRGFKVCNNAGDILEGYKTALKFSPRKAVIVEDYIPYDSVIIHYTMMNGKCFFSGMADKYSARFSSTGAPVMGVQIFQSHGVEVYQKELNDKVCHMFESAGFKDGPIWIEAFYDGNQHFIFNEMGYRFGGSLTYYPVKYFYGIDQLDLLIGTAVSTLDPIMRKTVSLEHQHRYCILPVHIKAGRISRIEGLDEVKMRPDVFAYVPVHFRGDTIQDWGSAQQVFCYLHILFDSSEALLESIKEILGRLKALDDDGNNMLYPLFDIEKIPEIC